MRRGAWLRQIQSNADTKEPDTKDLLGLFSKPISFSSRACKHDGDDVEDDDRSLLALSQCVSLVSVQECSIRGVQGRRSTCGSSHILETKKEQRS